MEQGNLFSTEVAQCLWRLIYGLYEHGSKPLGGNRPWPCFVRKFVLSYRACDSVRDGCFLCGEIAVGF
jgi:hypothetical protein